MCGQLLREGEAIIADLVTSRGTRWGALKWGRNHVVGQRRSRGSEESVKTCIGTLGRRSSVQLTGLGHEQSLDRPS
ncbi:hypothetical protein Tco_0761930 [Tanacetum coccineum]